MAVVDVINDWVLSVPACTARTARTAPAADVRRGVRGAVHGGAAAGGVGAARGGAVARAGGAGAARAPLAGGAAARGHGGARPRRLPVRGPDTINVLFYRNYRKTCYVILLLLSLIL